MYHGALNTILSIFDCTLCMIFVLGGLDLVLVIKRTNKRRRSKGDT